MTSPSHLIDSNICIYILEGLSAAARRRIEMFEPGTVVTSAIAYGEVMRGLDPADEVAIAKTKALFAVIDVLPFDRRAAEAYRMLRFKRASFDRLIGAHARALGLTLVTNNVCDYADIEGLTIENWTKE